MSSRASSFPVGSGLDAVLLEDALNGGAPEVEAEVLERAAKTCVAPRGILPRHRQQLPDPVSGRTWTTGVTPGTTPVVLRRDSLSVPTQDRFRRRERGHLGQQPSPERLTSLGEQPPLGVFESQ